MKGFTAFLKEPPSENSSWFGLGRKTKGKKDYVVTASQGGWDEGVVDDKLEQTVPDVDSVVQESAANSDVAGDSFSSKPVERERWRRNPQKTKMREWWVADNMAKQCYECRSTFGVLTRRHHCRVCGQIFCWRCSANFLPGDRLGFTTEASLRLCVCCYAMWQADKAATDRSTNLGPLSTKAQGIARQATRTRSASDIRASHASPKALDTTDKKPNLKSPDYTPRPQTKRELNSSIDPMSLAQPDWDAGSEVDMNASQAGPPPEVEWSVEEAETAFLTHCAGADSTKMNKWRNEVRRLKDERLKTVNTPTANDTGGELDGMICPVGGLPDRPPIIDREADDIELSIESAAHEHLHGLVYRLMADLIVTGTDTRGGAQPTDDRLLTMMQHLKPLISRALWAKPARAPPSKLKPTQPPSLTMPRADLISPPEDCQQYAATAAALVAGALLGQTIENHHDLDMAVIDAIKRRPDNNPESLVELVLGSPRISVCISKNMKVLNARCFENQFIKYNDAQFVLRDGVKWVMQQYGVRREQAIEGVSLLYRRNVILPELRGGNEPEQLERRVRICGGESEIDLTKKYKVVRGTQLIDDDSLSHEGYVEMLTGFREHSFEDDAKTIDPNVWTDVICRLAWKVATTLFPSVWRDKDEVMDIREYIKVVKIEGGSPWDSEYVCGSVVSGSLANRRMPSELSNPRVLLVGDQIDFEATTVVTDFASLVQSKKDGVVAKDCDGSWLDILAAKVKLVRPDLVLVEKSVNLKVQEQLCEAQIALATSITPKSLSRVKKTTHATIVKHLARIPTSYLRASAEDDETLHPEAPRLGHCKGFTTRRVGSQSLMYIYGGDTEKGCAVVLRGASTAVLRRLKEVLKFAAFMAHNLVLETHYFEDAQGCIIPTTAARTGPRQDLAEVRQDTTLLSSSLCVDFQVPDLLTTKRRRADEDDKQQLAASQSNITGGATLLDVPGNNNNGCDLSHGSLPHVDSTISFTSTQPDETARTAAEKKQDQTLTLCRELGYFNPMCHQSILVHHTITRVTAQNTMGKPGGPSEEQRSHSQSIFSTSEAPPSLERRNTGIGQTLSGKLYNMSAKDLASQAHQFGHLRGEKDGVDEHNNGHGSGLERHEKGDSTLMRMPGDTCREFKKLLIEYYRIGRNKGSDIPLVFYLAEHFSLASSPSVALPKRQYSHNKGRLTVCAERVADEEFHSDFVLMWTYCKKCKRNVSPHTECSRYTLSYSFGKFLETSFYNFKVVSRSCSHSLHGDLVRCFGQTVQQDGFGKPPINVQVKFDYEPVEVYTLEFPELGVTYDETVFNNFVISEHNDLIASIQQGYQNVSAALEELEAYEQEVGIEFDDATRQRVAKEVKATLDGAQSFRPEEGAEALSAVTVMDMNAMRKDLHAALQGWGKELSEKWLAARAHGDKTVKPKSSKWRDMLKRDDVKGHHHTASTDFPDFTKLTQDTDHGEKDVGRLLSTLSALEKTPETAVPDSNNTLPQPADELQHLTSPMQLPPPPPSPHVMTPPLASDVDKGELQISPDLATAAPILISPQKRGSNLPGLPVPRGDDMKSTSSGMSPIPHMEGMSPQPTSSDFSRTATNEGLGESPPVKSPTTADRRQSSLDFDVEKMQGVMPQLRKAALKGKSSVVAKDVPTLKMPSSLSGPGVLVNLATGAEDLTVIVRLDEPTSVIAYTLCSEQYKRACQPNTPPASPLRSHQFRSPYLFRGAPLLSPTGGNGTTTPPELPPPMDSSTSSLNPPSMPFPTQRISSSVDIDQEPDQEHIRKASLPMGSPDIGPSGVPDRNTSRQQDIDNLLEVLAEKMRRVEIKEFEEVTAGNDPKGTTHLRFACNVLCARQFAALRQYYCKGDETTFIASLSRCISFAPTGGRTGASYYKSRDGRFVLKAIKAEEVQHFEQVMAKKYFEYVARAIRKRMPTILTKILGVFKITIAGSNGAPTSTNWLLMENLFYNKKIDRTFDLKGSRRNRYQTNQNAVLLDENLLHMLKDGEWLFTKEESKEILTMGVHNDTLMLRRSQIMDYSMLLGVDDTKKEIYVGVIDFMRAYDMKKQLEWVVKSSGIMGGRGQQPTVVDPTKYKERFRAAMNNYFLMIPDKATPWVIKHRKYQTLTDPGSELSFDLQH